MAVKNKQDNVCKQQMPWATLGKPDFSHIANELWHTTVIVVRMPSGGCASQLVFAAALLSRLFGCVIMVFLPFLILVKRSRGKLRNHSEIWMRTPTRRVSPNLSG